VNRQTKRLMQRQGQVRPDGTPAPRAAPPRPATRPTRERLTPSAYTREVRAELRKVAWPTREELINYSVVVLVAVVLLTALIFALDYVFAKGVLFLFNT
jgi:preprotein translocase subunit SecE